MSTFSMNGSPTCTAGRLVGPVSSNVSDASTETPPMPSPPVRGAEQHDAVAGAGRVRRA